MYVNDGNYNTSFIEEAKFEYQIETGNIPESDFDQGFVDWLVERTISIATGRSVKKFLREGLKIKSQNGNIWRQYQIRCILKTYSNIISAIKDQ